MTRFGRFVDLKMATMEPMTYMFHQGLSKYAQLPFDDQFVALQILWDVDRTHVDNKVGILQLYMALFTEYDGFGSSAKAGLGRMKLFEGHDAQTGWQAIAKLRKEEKVQKLIDEIKAHHQSMSDYVIRRNRLGVELRVKRLLSGTR